MTGLALNRLRRATALAGLTAAALLPPTLPAFAQQVMDEISGSAQSLLFRDAAEPALAPTANRLGHMTYGDRTPTAFDLETAEPSRNVTLPGTPSGEGSAATVLADSVTLQGDRTLIASGGVVVWHQGTRLVASRIVVDGETRALTIEGPIHLTRPDATDADSEAILIADSAQLDGELQDGIIRGARLLLARELQLAAREAERSQGGRFTELRQVVASSCQICASDPTPLWEIRARSILHDAEQRMIHLSHPQLRAFGVPLGGLPFTVTAPDPTVERMSGFLQPQFRTTSKLGFGIKLPYFQTLGDHADLTITPYLSASRTRTLELRYRHAFQTGAMVWSGAVTLDDINPGETRGYLFGNAMFELPRGYTLGVQVQTASDRGYLLDYGVADADRLWSGLTLTRVRRDKMVFGRVGNYHSLRDDEDNATSPAQVADVLWLRRFTPNLIGGEALMEWSVHAHRRPSDDNGPNGRDMARGSFGLDWRRSEILPGGVLGAALMGLDADIYRIAQDNDFDDLVTRIDPMIGVELRWPLIGHSAGATHLVEPVAQILWSPRGQDDDIPNEDSRLIEFDEGNLFSDNRFPGWDARETGLRANLGISWTRIDPAGWSLGMTAGRVFRSHHEENFPDGSPLAGRKSDWLVAANYDSGKGLALVNRSLFNDSLEFSRNELRVGWLREDLQLSAGHLWIDGDQDEGRTSDINEVTANIGWQIADGWWGSAETRYDFSAERAQRASLDVTYRNECLALEMGLSRRFTRTDTVTPETSFDLSVRLGGFGAQKVGPGTVARRSCLR